MLECSYSQDSMAYLRVSKHTLRVPMLLIDYLSLSSQVLVVVFLVRLSFQSLLPFLQLLHHQLPPVPTMTSLPQYLHVMLSQRFYHCLELVHHVEVIINGVPIDECEYLVYFAKAMIMTFCWHYI